MNRSRLAAVSAIALGACAHSKLRQEKGWSEVRTEHLVVATDLDPRAAAEVVEHLERIELGLLQRWWPGAGSGGRPLHVVLLGSDDEIREFAAPGVGGYYTNAGGLNGAFMVATADEDGVARRFNSQLPLKHELTHHLLESVMRQVPLWVNEGFATYMEGLELDLERDLLRIGKPSPVRLSELGGHGFSAWVLTRADLGDWSPADVRNVMNAQFVPDRGFEARAWQLFFHLANAHTEDLDAYLRLLWTGETNAEAAKKALATLSPEILARELTSRYRAHSIAYTFTELPLPRLSARARIRPMAPAEMHAQLAELLWTAQKPDARKRAGPEARAALASDPAGTTSGKGRVGPRSRSRRRPQTSRPIAPTSSTRWRQRLRRRSDAPRLWRSSASPSSWRPTGTAGSPLGRGSRPMRRAARRFRWSSGSPLTHAPASLARPVSSRA